MLKVGILFGGSSAEREISFAGGRTVYDNLDKSLFEPIPIFIDSYHNFIELNWQYLYKGTIRDFYPPTHVKNTSLYGFQLYIENICAADDPFIETAISAVGKRIFIEDLPKKIDIAFLCLHGNQGEDGAIQGLLEWLGIPYTGSGILGSAMGIDKAWQKDVYLQNRLPTPEYITIYQDDFVKHKDKNELFEQIVHLLGLPLVIKPARQGSSIGVTILPETCSAHDFVQAIYKAFGIVEIELAVWRSLSTQQKVQHLKSVIDLKQGIGLPVYLNGSLIRHPDGLLSALDILSELYPKAIAQLWASQADQEIIVEQYIKGREFSCIVIEDLNGQVVALPPTEIKKTGDIYDYSSKYMPGRSRKITPMEVDEATLQKICKRAEDLFYILGSEVYARIDGFLSEDNQIYLNDPNTTSGMLPSSFFFHQAAEIGLNPSQFLTYIIYTSLQARKLTGKNPYKVEDIQKRLKSLLEQKKEKQSKKIRVAVVMGGYSYERHISVESGRNVYEKLSSSTQFEPIPVFLIGDESYFELWQIPVSMMLKDNADDIRDKILHLSEKENAVLKEIRNRTKEIVELFGNPASVEKPKKIQPEEYKQIFDFCFIALHGRPGEDGQLQTHLEKYGIPYNGSRADTSAITINKYLTNELLQQAGFKVARHALITKQNFTQYRSMLKFFKFPLVAKPVDDGCSAAVVKIKTWLELEAYASLLFRETDTYPKEACKILDIDEKIEFPKKNEFLVEEWVGKESADHFLEITGGLLTYYDEEGNIQYQVFNASETLAEKEILSIEEKFLAGQGQNITPARYDLTQPELQEYVNQVVKETLRQVAIVLNIQGYARIDAFVRVWKNPLKVEVIIIEVNSLPGMTPATCIFHQAALENYKPLDFIQKIIEFGMQRSKVQPL
ncbi:MAG: ATP-grasp domain-containing protein [Bacteroidia bacterium]|nr:ATP-grasp domain-containing protein [Bacteroidia bacterium]MDW8301768.1 D-alanine--D-alanine ligase [Bacteroidia bacterium]